MSRTKRKKVIKLKAARLERVHYRLLIVLIIVAIIHYTFFSATMIGGDRRYALYIFWLPTLCGILAIAFYRRRFLMREYQESPKSPWSVLLFLFYFAQAFIFSYLSIGQIAQISWTIMAKQVGEKNQVETMKFPVSRFFYHRGTVDVEFKFDGRHEELKTRHRDLIGYEEVLAKDYVVEISARKSIWNYYLVDDWEIIKK